MPRLIAPARARLARTNGDDSGFTLIEVVIVLVIMSIVLVIFTTGITQAFSAENKVDTASSAENQLVIAFERLDKEVRYASAISNPGTQAGDPVVEWLSPDLTVANQNICTEVRLDPSTGLVQQRTWIQNSSPLTPGGWAQLASGVAAATPAATGASASVLAPFATIQPDSVFQFQRIEFAVVSTFGTNSSATSKHSDITFTALNTTSSTSSPTVCTEGRGVSW